MKNNQNNRRKTQSERAEDILGMIRARNQEVKEGGSNKLREILNTIHYEDETVEDYTTTPIYELGFEDGWNGGYDIARQEFRQELSSLKVVLDSLIKAQS